MKNSRILLLFLVPFTAFSYSFGQNKFDSEGKKTGYWIVSYENGKTRYESAFIADKPVGMMKRYLENGTLSAEMMFDTIEDRCFARLYHENRKLAAEGWFAGQKKDSVWTYYSEQDGHVLIREPYKNGMIHGTALSYYPGGQVSERMDWVEDSKEGKWLLFYEDGGLRSEGNYSKGLREGKYTAFHTDSTLELSGIYKNNVADGDWKLFDEAGNLLFTYKYSNGKLLNESELLKRDDEVLNKLQDIPDPDDPEEQ